MTDTILFVDDEPHVLDALRRNLRRRRPDWSVDCATSYAEAMTVLARGDVGAVVSDLHMPGKNGLELLQAVRAAAATRDVPVVILTGSGNRELKRRALESGATDLLSKPVDMDELVARIGNMLQLRAYQDEIRGQNARLEAKVRERTAALEASRVELIWRLGIASEYRDNDTGNHIVRVGYFALELATALGLDRELADTVFLTAPLHDVGKIGIPDTILLKPGRLTADEWQVMRRHPEIGAEILRKGTVDHHPFEIARVQLARALPAPSTNPFLEMAARISLAHHERWDGRGYPHRLAGEEIPLEARITTVADVYDALSSKRPYKEPLEQAEVLHLMRRGVGSQFDPEVFAAFERSVDAFQEIRAHFPDEGLDVLQADLVKDVQELLRAPLPARPRTEPPSDAPADAQPSEAPAEAQPSDAPADARPSDRA